jgi:hypothetical protein
MITRQRIVTFGIPTAALATVTAAALLSPWTKSSEPSKPEPIVATSGHQIDVVIAVDTTGSMGGLIDSAKRTVWSIASHIRKTDEQADIRVGLVAYRDIGDDYVTRDFALSSDLDAVFAELSSYQPAYDELAREAASKHITINAIRAGHDSDTEVAFQQMASVGGGAYSSIQQDGGVQQVATPYDAKMAELSEKIDSTVIVVGDEGVRRAYEANMRAAEAAPAAAKADRAGYYATKGSGGRAAGTDLVGGVQAGTMSFDGIAGDSLPADMRGMDKNQLAKEVEKRAQQRSDAQEELGELAKKRDEYLDANKPGAVDAFDTKVKQAIELQIK